MRYGLPVIVLIVMCTLCILQSLLHTVITAICILVTTNTIINTVMAYMKDLQCIDHQEGISLYFVSAQMLIILIDKYQSCSMVVATL